MAVADNADVLVAMIADKLLGGEISPTLESEARDAILRVAPSNRATRASEALFLVATSPEFAVQH